MKKSIIFGLLAIVVVLIIVFAIGGIGGGDVDSRSSTSEAQGSGAVNLVIEENNGGVVEEAQNDEDSSDTQNNAASGWRSIPLTNVLNGESYTIADLSDKPILMEIFAVWCPTCTKQQREDGKLHDDPEIGDSFHSVALNTDQNEDAAKVKNHAESNGFDWRYSISPEEMTNLLIDEFGLSVVNAPSAPMILVCDGESQAAHFLERGVKTADELKNSINTLC